MSPEPVTKLRDELVAAAERRIAIGSESADQPAEAAHRRRVGRLPLVAAIALAVLVLTAVALAAGLISIGKPYRPPSYLHYNHAPGQGLGVPIPASVQVLSLSTPDPHGGPPWGMRVLKTTRALGCLQVGRLVDGQIGVLGIDGVANDDGRFHALPTDILSLFSCEPVDVNGLTSINVSEPTAYAYGTGIEQSCAGVGTLSPGTPRCPTRDLRAIYYGLLGPQALSVTYTASGVSHTIHPVGPQGAYLIVLPTPNLHVAFGTGATPTLPGTPPFERITFKNGVVCNVAANLRRGVLRPCPAVGFTPVGAPRLTRADVAGPVTARVARQPGYWSVSVTFTARVHVPNANSGYELEVAPPRTCNSPGIYGTNTSANIAKGQTVHLQEALGSCTGRYSGVVYFESVIPSPTAGPVLPPSFSGTKTPPATIVVGRFSVQIR